MPPTQQEIARKLGLSLKTVQRAFNQPETVSPIVRDRVYEFAARINYSPNRGARALQGSRRHRVALFSRSTPSFFWNDVAIGARIAARQLSQLGLEFHYRRVSSYDSCIRALRTVVRDGVDCIGLVNHTGMQMERILEWIRRRDLPFAAFNIDFEGVERLCYLGIDYERQGMLAGEVIAKLLPDGGALGILTSPETPGSFLPGADIQNRRHRGLQAALEEFPSIRREEIPIRTKGVEADPDKVLRAIQSIAGRNRIVICIPSIPSYLLRYLHDTPPDKRPGLIGFDLSPQTTSLLEHGLITAEIYQNPSLQGYGIVKLLDTFLETGRKPSRDRYLITPQVIFSSNVDQRNVFDIIAEISEPSHAWTGALAE